MQKVLPERYCQITIHGYSPETYYSLNYCFGRGVNHSALLHSMNDEDAKREASVLSGFPVDEISIEQERT